MLLFIKRICGVVDAINVFFHMIRLLSSVCVPAEPRHSQTAFIFSLQANASLSLLHDDVRAIAPHLWAILAVPAPAQEVLALLLGDLDLVHELPEEALAAVVRAGAPVAEALGPRRLKLVARLAGVPPRPQRIVRVECGVVAPIVGLSGPVEFGVFPAMNAGAVVP